MSLREAVLKIQSTVSKVEKDGFNPHTKKNYSTIEAVLDVLNGPLQENKVVVTQTTRKANEEWVLCTTLSLGNDSKDVDTFDTPLLGLGAGSNPMQALGSAISYARRYSLISYFKLCQSDDDGENAGQDSMNYTKEKSQPKPKEIKNHAPKPKDLKIADGKYKDKMVSSIPQNELADYIAFVSSALQDSGKAEPPWFKELREVSGL